MITGVELDTAVVTIVNVALVLPTKTATDEGTVTAEVLLLDKEIVTPPLGAGLLSVTVPCEPLPPVTLVGLRLIEFSDGGEIVRVAV
jgi:hypothetical protein